MINQHKQNFIDFCNNKYNFLYDYSEINYINGLSPIKIKCKKCNKEMIITPKYHKKNCVCNCKTFNNKKEIDFIKLSNLKHGNKYDYSKVKFIDNLTPVIIICKIHGEFEIIPKIHKNGSGCKHCNQHIRTKEELLNDLNYIHKNKYIYDLSNYKNLKTKINIVCPIHGNFIQEIRKHLVGSECRKCANKKISDIKTKNINIMIDEFKIIHKDRYDYSNMNYQNFSIKINVICKIHGNFKIFPTNHKNGVGCPKCNKSSKPMELNDLLEKFNVLYDNKYQYPNIINLYKNQQSRLNIICPIHGEFKQSVILHLNSDCKKCNSKLQTNEKIINDFILKHGKIYDYSKVNYVASNIPVEIICKKHGSFFQNVSNHKNGQKCLKCYNEGQSELNRFPLKKYIKEANLTHKNKYDYSLVKSYNNLHDKIEIICPIHGFFKQIAKVHRYGSGCPKCCVTGFDNNKHGILYYILIDGKYYKIGITNRSIQERFQSDSIDIKVIKEWYYEDGEECYNMEQYYLKEFEWAKAKNVNILNGGNSELFLFDILNLDFD